MQKVGKSQLRIIGGKWRGRKLEFLELPDVRPTLDRVRETLFNWLMFPIRDAVCLDLFSGSGALAFEAVSRGAQGATVVDVDPVVGEQIRNEARRFDTDQITVVTASVEKFFGTCSQPYDVIFLDPPYKRALLEKTLTLIATSHCVPEQGAYVYVECRKGTQFTIPEDWQILRQSHTAHIQYALAAIDKRLEYGRGFELG